MKKFTKIVLITALILVVAGGILFGAGVASGASWETLRSHTLNNRFVGNWIDHLDEYEEWDENYDYDYDYDDKYDDNEEHDRDYSHNTSSGEYVAAADTIEALSVKLEAGEIQIKETSGSEIKISGLHSSDTVYYEEGDKELSISRNLHHDVEKTAMVIEIPKDKTFRELDLHVSAGELIASGKLTAEESSLQVEAGNLETALLDSRETDIECSAGNLSVKHTGKLADYYVEMDASMGNLSLDGKQYAGLKREETFGTQNSSRHIDIECKAGNVTVDFEAN